LVAFLWANNSLREKSGNQSYSQYPEKFKYVGINLTKEVKEFYNENYKTLKKEIEEYARRWSGRINIVKMAILLEAGAGGVAQVIECQ
jgi:hypothetical protein